MFDSIKASKEIKDSYIDYITTTFDMADTDYEREFRKELQTDGMVAVSYTHLTLPTIA